MNRSFQNEIPKARINITLDVDTRGSQKKTELPLKLLVLGKFGKGADADHVGEREKISVNQENINKILQDLSPSVHCVVPNHIQKKHAELDVSLTFTQYKDFHPENMVQQVPVLKKLLAMRNLLKELKANMVDNQALRSALESAMANQKNIKKLQSELKQLEANGA